MEGNSSLHIFLKRILGLCHPLLPCHCKVSGFAPYVLFAPVFCLLRCSAYHRPKGNRANHGLNENSGSASQKKSCLILSPPPQVFGHSDRKLANTGNKRN